MADHDRNDDTGLPAAHTRTTGDSPPPPALSSPAGTASPTGEASSPAGTASPTGSASYPHSPAARIPTVGNSPSPPSLYSPADKFPRLQRETFPFQGQRRQNFPPKEPGSSSGVQQSQSLAAGDQISGEGSQRAIFSIKGQRLQGVGSPASSSHGDSRKRKIGASDPVLGGQSPALSAVNGIRPLSKQFADIIAEIEKIEGQIAAKKSLQQKTVAGADRLALNSEVLSLQVRLKQKSADKESLLGQMASRASSELIDHFKGDIMAVRGQLQRLEDDQKAVYWCLRNSLLVVARHPTDSAIQTHNEIVEDLERIGGEVKMKMETLRKLISDFKAHSKQREAQQGEAAVDLSMKRPVLMLFTDMRPLMRQFASVVAEIGKFEADIAAKEALLLKTVVGNDRCVLTDEIRSLHILLQQKFKDKESLRVKIAATANQDVLVRFRMGITNLRSRIADLENQLNINRGLMRSCLLKLESQPSDEMGLEYNQLADDSERIAEELMNEKAALESLQAAQREYLKESAEREKLNRGRQ